jgi:glycosyltransferase involved in cell wall biosynthesis
MRPSRQIAIAIACYNQARFLEDAITSALSQTRRAAEVIVVDDGSTDDTAAFVAKFPSASYVYQTNSGLSAARNTALYQTSAEYIIFLDADDVLRPLTCQACLDAFSAHPDAAFVYGGFWYVDGQRRFIAESVPQSHPDEFAALLRGNHIAMHGTVMYRAEILRKLGGFDESLPCCEDYDVYLRVAQIYPIASYKSIAAEYRRHDNNATKNAALQLKTSRAVLRRYQSVARRSDDLHAAYAEGHRFWSEYYGNELVEFIAEGRRRGQSLGSLAAVALTGLKHDPRFALRLGCRLGRKMVSRLGLRQALASK